MIEFSVKGDFKNTESFFKNLMRGDIFSQLDSIAREGVIALSNATPIESGETAAAWSYEIEKKPGYYRIIWTNRHMADGTPVAILLQYGHATGTGGYVQGRDYINPALKPIFDKMSDQAWKAVTSA